MLSPRSRGKGGLGGSRRGPWRDGGRRKQKRAVWRKQAVHAIDTFPKNSGELVELTYFGPWPHSAAESIYLFDQRIAGTGIRYQAELRGGWRFEPLFIIRVPASAAAKVSAIIAQIKKR
jgi:hypothetical protein